MQRKFKSIILFIGVLLSIASILMLFLPAATIENFNLTGWEIVFGTIEIENDSESFGISVAGIFLILLLILGFLFLIASWRQKIAKNDKAAKVLGILSSVFSATSGILFFFLKDTGALAELNVFDIGIGSILGGIAAILSAICSAVAALSSDLSDKSEKPIQKERHIIKQFKEKNGRSLLAIITDDKNNEELTLVDECGKEYKFEQLWYKPYRNATYCILTEINEVQPDQKETYIFFFVKKGTELVLQQEFDERNCQQVLKDYSEYKKQKHLNTKQQAEMHKADSQDNRTKVEFENQNNGTADYIQPKMSEKGKKGIMIGLIVIYSLSLLFGILLICVPQLQTIPTKIGICKEISTQSYSLTLGIVWIALTPSLGYYFATISPFSFAKKTRLIIAVITTILLILTNVTFFLIINLVKIDGLIEIKYFYEDEDVWFIPLSMVFATIGVMICYLLTLFRMHPERIKNFKPKFEKGNVSAMLKSVLLSIFAFVIKLVKLILTFKEKQPDIFILISSILLILLTYFTSFIFAIICLAIIIVTVIMMFSGLVEFSNDVFSKTIIADGKTLRLVHNISGQPQKYVDDSGNVYYSEDNGKTVYK